VRFVCHADLPQSIEAYYQEIGRAGRDGLPAEALLLFGEADIRLRERQIEEGDAPPERKRMERRKLNALLALCETPRCRRQTLLAAFGEDSAPCGNCDVCDGEWPLFAGAVAAQKVMSAIHRTSGRFFSGHLANLLIGNATAAITRHGHHLLPTFGAGKEFRPAQWRSIFRQLHAAELIAQDSDDRDRWILTRAGREVLAGRAELDLRAAPGEPALRRALRQIDDDEDRPPDAAPAPRAEKTSAPDLTATEMGLLAALKAKRLEIARARKQPPFVIFHDSVLVGIARARPRTPEALHSVPGVGPVKLARFGAIFLDVVRAHDSER
jgi:ATP-dependent DNA helicase RecQ